MSKQKTNDQLLRALIKDCNHPFEMALLRERLQKISELTREAVEEDPKSFNNFMFNHSWFLRLCNKIDKHLGTDDKEPG